MLRSACLLRSLLRVVALSFFAGAVAGSAPGQAVPAPSAFPVLLPSGLPVLPAEQAQGMDRDLMEVTIPQLEALYAGHRYTVEQVTRWYLSRIARYNGVYRSVQTVDGNGALATARREDADRGSEHGPLWGVPMVIKANTAVKGLLDTDGWAGFAIPGHEFMAPRDATAVARLRAAGAVILGITNMPDFAASDTNRSTAFGRTGDAYDVRFSPGGSSGGTVTAVTSNEAVLGNGTDTGNSIRMPAGTSAVVGLFPTRGMVSIAGIAPLDWLLDNTGPIARDVTDVAIALGVMAGVDPADPLDFKTAEAAKKRQPGPYTQYLKADALKGKRFGVPAFIFTTTGTPLQPETKAMLMKTVEMVRAAGAEVVMDPALLPDSFLAAEKRVDTGPYRRDGAMQWLGAFGPAQYHDAAQYKAATGRELPPVFTGVGGSLDDLVEATSGTETSPIHPGAAGSGATGVAHGAERWKNLPPQRALKGDPEAEKNYFGPRDAMLAEYTAALDRFHLDGLIYPSAQMPPPDETMPQDGKVSGGPHSETGWVNKIGVPAITVPAGFYPNGLPFGLEMSARPWRDGDLLGWAFGFEQATKLRRPPVLVEGGLTTAGPYRQ